MIGEIRDRETAQIAVESALTGHLVLSTLHTNNAPGALSRLTEMGVEPFLTARRSTASSLSAWCGSSANRARKPIRSLGRCSSALATPRRSSTIGRT